MDNRRTIWGVAFRCVTALLCAGAAAMAGAQAYPVRPVRIIVPFVPGGPTDATARPLAGKLGEAFGQTFLVDNRPGANTIVGAEITARATPDGHTLFFAAQNTLCINPYTYRKLPYDVQKDFAPVALLTHYSYLVVARPGLAARTVPELVAYARANPGRVTYASVGEGSSGHLGYLLLESMAGISMTHVPYKGNAPMITDMMGGSVDLGLMGLAAVQGQVKAGKLRLLAIAADKRLDELPDLPTVAEAGYPGFASGTWVALVTQAAVPRPVITRLNQEVNRALQSPEIKGPMEAQKVALGSGTPEDLARMIAVESARWGKVLKSVNLQFD